MSETREAERLLAGWAEALKDVPSGPFAHEDLSRVLTVFRAQAEEIERLKALWNAVETERPIIDIYNRVHTELEAGRPWDEIDNGTTWQRQSSYDGWLAYMQQRFTNKLRSLLSLTAKGDAP